MVAAWRSSTSSTTTPATYWPASPSSASPGPSSSTPSAMIMRASTAPHVPQSPVTDDELLAVAVTMERRHDLTPATAATPRRVSCERPGPPPTRRRPHPCRPRRRLRSPRPGRRVRPRRQASSRPPHAVAALALRHAVIADLHAEHRPIVRDGPAPRWRRAHVLLQADDAEGQEQRLRGCPRGALTQGGRRRRRRRGVSGGKSNQPKR
jgi:hypothetical protein